MRSRLLAAWVLNPLESWEDDRLAGDWTVRYEARSPAATRSPRLSDLFDVNKPSLF